MRGSSGRDGQARAPAGGACDPGTGRPRRARSVSVPAALRAACALGSCANARWPLPRGSGGSEAERHSLAAPPRVPGVAGFGSLWTTRSFVNDRCCPRGKLHSARAGLGHPRGTALGPCLGRSEWGTPAEASARWAAGGQAPPRPVRAPRPPVIPGDATPAPTAIW